MNILRTPDERFLNLPDYPFPPHYVDIGGLRMHYVDEGSKTSPTILALHGEPSWSYLYRKMIPIFSAKGYRTIVPDLIGFGRSDKLAERADYSYQRHVDWLSQFIKSLGLRDIILVCQDWGGLIGLRITAFHAELFRCIVAANTFLPTGEDALPDAFFQWQRFSQETPSFSAGKIIAISNRHRKLDPAVIAAYDAPFPDERYLAGARQFPMLVPIHPDDPQSIANRQAWQTLNHWGKAVFDGFQRR